jgi:hypothetical protein
LSRISQSYNPPKEETLLAITSKGRVHASFNQVNHRIVFTNNPSTIHMQLVKLHCDYDITLFPFDNQTCVIVLGPWEHNASEIYISLPRKRGGVLNVSAA